jgi:hypothetical protein
VSRGIRVKEQSSAEKPYSRDAARIRVNIRGDMHGHYEGALAVWRKGRKATLVGYRSPVNCGGIYSDIWDACGGR